MERKITTKEERRILNSMFWRSHLTFFTFNMVKMEANAFTITMAPAIESLYKDDEEGKKAAILRSQNFFNTHVIPFSFIAGLTYAMEKEHKEKGSIDGATIDSIKTALMGPTAGMFDSLFFNGIRVLTAGIAIDLCAQGYVLGVILFVLLYGVPHSILKYLFTYWGYTLGTSFIDRVFNSGLMSAMTKAASVLGLIMVGAMTSQMVEVPVGFVFADLIGSASSAVNIGKIIDYIFPGILSVALLFSLIFLIKKGVRPIWLVLIVLGLGMLGALAGIF